MIPCILKHACPTPEEKKQKFEQEEVHSYEKKAHELAHFCDTDVTLIIHTCKDGRYFTCNSTESRALVTIERANSEPLSPI